MKPLFEVADIERKLQCVWSDLKILSYIQNISQKIFISWLHTYNIQMKFLIHSKNLE